MTPEVITRLRKQLEDDQAATITQLQVYGADPYSERVERIAGISDNFADSAAATAERSEMLALIVSERERLAAIDEALERMQEGMYGICATCGEAIPEARLEARPLSVQCVRCASAGASASKR